MNIHIGQSNSGFWFLYTHCQKQLCRKTHIHCQNKHNQGKQRQDNISTYLTHLTHTSYYVLTSYEVMRVQKMDDG